MHPLPDLDLDGAARLADRSLHLFMDDGDGSVGGKVQHGVFALALGVLPFGSVPQGIGIRSVVVFRQVLGLVVEDAVLDTQLRLVEQHELV